MNTLTFNWSCLDRVHTAPETLCRAKSIPDTTRAPRRALPVMAAVACALVILLGVGVLWMGRDTTPPPVAPDGGTASTTINTPATITTTTVPNGTGGDENMCTVHQFHYHAIDGNLIRYVGKEKMNAFIETYSGKGEICNIVTFVEFCGLSREQFIEAMEWENILDQTADIQSAVGGETAPYTYGDFVEAVFGDDPAHSARIFASEIFAQQIEAARASR